MASTCEMERKRVSATVNKAEVESLREYAKLIPGDELPYINKKYGHNIIRLLDVDVSAEAIQTLAQFYDSPMRCFTFRDFQMAPTLEEYSQILGFSLKDIDKEKPTYKCLKEYSSNLDDVAAVLRVELAKFERVIQKQHGIQIIPQQYLEERMKDLANKKDWISFMDVLALTIYGIVLFPCIKNYVDMAAFDVFMAVKLKEENPVPAILADTYCSFTYLHEENNKNAKLRCCLPMLYVWLTAHVFIREGSYKAKDPIEDFKLCDDVKKMKNKLVWIQHLSNLKGETIRWYPHWEEIDEVIYQCLPMLYVWLTAHVFIREGSYKAKDPIEDFKLCDDVKKMKNKLVWIQHLSNLKGETIRWYPHWEEIDEVIYQCLPMLYVWLTAHVFIREGSYKAKDPIEDFKLCDDVKKMKNKLVWIQHLSNLKGETIRWYPHWEEIDEVIYQCLPMLYVWLTAHVFIREGSYKAKDPIEDFKLCDDVKKMKNKLVWIQHLSNLKGETIRWYPHWEEIDEVIYQCGNYQNVPLIGTKGCIDYNPFFGLRQLGYSIKSQPPNQEKMTPFVIYENDLSGSTKLKRCREAWSRVTRKDGKELGKRSCGAGVEYQKWLEARVEKIKLPYSSSLPPIIHSDHGNEDEVEKLRNDKRKLQEELDISHERLKKMAKIEEERDEAREEVGRLKIQLEELTKRNQ